TLSPPGSSSTSASQELSLKSLQEGLPNTAKENSNQNTVSTPNTVVSTTKRDPTYGLENTAMDNYTHIDMPDDIRALSQRMILENYQEKVANLNSINIATRSTTVTAATVSRPNKRVISLESRAMDAYKNTNNPVEPPSSRGPQTLLSDQTTSITNHNASHSWQNSALKSLPPRAPQVPNFNASNHVTTTFKNAKLGDQVAQKLLGDMYKEGRGVAQDYHHAMTWYLMSANQGHPGAQYSIGCLYQSGKGVSQDYRQAIHWFREAADQGYATAQCDLGLVYYRGLGMSPDYPKALYRFRKAADQGHVTAQRYLGKMHEKGRGVPQNFRQAVFWSLKAANQGDRHAQYDVGLHYHHGHGVPQDYSQAMIWLRKSADQGLAEAQRMIGHIYSNGVGVAQDMSLAMEWYGKAADQGLVGAQYSIGVLCQLTNDTAKAVGWLEKAADGGHVRARKKLDRLKRQVHSRQTFESFF
ncbi:hypothetical protein BGZ96_006602, partial [Linnemannia gamsii]